MTTEACSEVVRVDRDVTDITTTSKSFVYKWTISNFRTQLSELPFLTSYDDSPGGDDADDQKLRLWRIELKVDPVTKVCKTFDMGPCFSKASIAFDAKTAKMDYDYYELCVHVVERSGKERGLYGPHKSTAASVALDVNLNLTYQFLLNEASELLPSGNLTLKFEVTFAKRRLLRGSLDLGARNRAAVNERRLAAMGRMLNSEELSDARIVAGGETFRVHKFALASQSSVFAAMFRHGTTESREGCGVIEIKDVGSEVVAEMLRFVYTGGVSDIKPVAMDLLALADMYDLEDLRLMCEEALIGEACVENAVALLVQAERHGSKRFKELVVNFFKFRAREIAKTEAFVEEFNSVVQIIPNVFQLLF